MASLSGMDENQVTYHMETKHTSTRVDSPFFLNVSFGCSNQKPSWENLSATPVVARLLTPSSKSSNVAATPAATPAANTVSVENEVSESASDPHSLR